MPDYLSHWDDEFPMTETANGVIPTDDDIIKMFESFVTDTNAGCKWIPITADTMPEKEKDVLLCFGKNIAVGYWTEGNKTLNVWWWANTGEETSCYCEDIPTHWAKIPELPERKRND